MFFKYTVRVLLHKLVTTDDFINDLHNYWGSGRPASVYWYISPGRTLPTVRIIVPSSRMASSPLTIIPQLISEQYMVELHSLPGRYTIFRYLADYVNTLSPIWYTLDNNTNPSGFSHIYTRKVLLPHIKHYHRDPTYSSLCNYDIYFTWVYTICASIKAMLSRPNTSRILHRVGGQRRVFQAALQAAPAAYIHENVMATSDQATSQSGPEYRTDTTDKAGNRLIQGMSH